MTPTHKPEDGDRAPISNRGAGLERFNVTEHFDPFDDASYGVMAASEGGAWVKLADATALLAEKAQRIERLEAALCDILAAHANDTTRPKAFYIASAALSQPHPHGG